MRRLVEEGRSLIKLLLLLEQGRETIDGPERVWMRIAELATTTVERLAVQTLGVVVLALVICLLYTSPSPRDRTRSRMPSSA